MNVQIESSWKEALKDEFEKPYFAQLVSFLKQEKQSGKIIYPEGKNIFNAFNMTPLSAVKVVILGQDPYHNPMQAHGLSFSVPDGVPLPPSLINIYKEIEDDLGVQALPSGNLSSWAQQGVLLLNAALTVEKNRPMSHSNIGWHEFTNAAIQAVSQHCEHVVFLLWGSFAQSKEMFIDKTKHLVLKAPHPSPLSAHRGFFGCKHFSRCNAYLQEHGQAGIQWGSSVARD